MSGKTGNADRAKTYSDEGCPFYQQRNRKNCL